MQQLLTTILSQQPWAVPVLACIATFALGLLIPKKAGGNWLSGIVFFLPNLLLDLLDIVHTKKFKYYGLILALLCIEAFFAFRASLVYYDVLKSHMSGFEMAVVSVIVFVAVGLCGYMVASHDKLRGWSLLTAAFVIAHDWSGVIYVNYGPGGDNTISPAMTALITIGMCGLSILPFIMGRWVEQLYPELEQEMEQAVDKFTGTATRKIKRRAVDRVLRLANHTNVVHLVRALPADEFSDFKAFVMPIIAPGTAHNLDDLEPAMSNDYEARINDLSNEIDALKMMQEPEVERHTDEIETVAEIGGKPDVSATEIGDETGDEFDDLSTEIGDETGTPSAQKPGRAATEIVAKTVARKGDPATLKRARRVVKHNPDIRPADLAKRLEISASYASQLKTRVLKETE